MIIPKPTMLKTPIIEHKGQVTVGFKADVQAAIKSA
jgi:arsenate reductase-like glutaredoxin family protein